MDRLQRLFGSSSAGLGQVMMKEEAGMAGRLMLFFFFFFFFLDNATWYGYSHCG
jgi:hypothetical protein